MKENSISPKKTIYLKSVCNEFQCVCGTVLLKWCHCWCFSWTDEVVNTLTYPKVGLRLSMLRGKWEQKSPSLFALCFSVKRWSLFKIYFKCWKKQQHSTFIDVRCLEGDTHRCNALAIRQANHGWEGIRLIKYAIFSWYVVRTQL